MDRTEWSGSYQMLAAHAEQEDSHRQQLHQAWKFYRGDTKDPLTVRPRRANDNVKANFTKMIVDKSVAFLFGQDVQFNFATPKDRGDGIRRTPEEEYLDDFWEFNRKGLLLQKLAVNGSVCGHAFLKIYIDADEAYPRLVIIDPSNVRIVCEEDNHEDIRQYIIQWNGIDRTIPSAPKMVIYRQIIEPGEGNTWNITDQKAVDIERARMSGWETVRTEVWPYDFPPIVDCQNLPSPNDYWGESDIEPDVQHMQLAINKALSNINRILRLYAHPKIFTKGLTQEQQRQIAIDADGLIHLPGNNGEIEVLQTSPDMSPTIDYYLKLREALHELSRTPEVATGKMENVGQLSGLALKILYGPMLEKTEQKRLTYGYLLKELVRRIMIIAGYGEDWIPTIIWPEIIPSDPYTEAQTALMLKQVGVSDSTILTRMGFDPEDEKIKSETENKRAIALQQQMMTHAPEQDAPQDPTAGKDGAV